MAGIGIVVVGIVLWNIFGPPSSPSGGDGSKSMTEVEQRLRSDTTGRLTGVNVVSSAGGAQPDSVSVSTSRTKAELEHRGGGSWAVKSNQLVPLSLGDLVTVTGRFSKAVSNPNFSLVTSSA